MDPCSYSSLSSSSSSSSSFTNPVVNNPQEQKRPTPPSPLDSSLHSVRKPPTKPWKKLLPTPPKIYRVDSMNFRKVVQGLTGARQSQSRRLQSVAPPPLNVLTPALSSDSNNSSSIQLFSPSRCSSPVEAKAGKLSDGSLAITSVGSCFSPLSNTWFSFPLLSPGTLASFEQGTVL